MFPLPFTTQTASYKTATTNLGFTVLPFPTVHSLLSNTARTCTLLSSLGFCRVLSGHHSAAVTLRAALVHLSRALETGPFTNYPGFKEVD